MKLQLLKNIKDHTSLRSIIESDEWIVQQKIDGQRIALVVNRGKAEMFNRKGSEMNVPKDIKAMLEPFDISFTLDGEYLNGIYYAFDLLSAGGHDTSYKSLQQRLFLLRPIVKRLKTNLIVPLDYAKTERDKAKYIKDLKQIGAEGIVAKNLGSPYLWGEKSSDCLKYKFYKTIDCVVGEIRPDGKEAVELMLYDKGIQKPVGKVKVLPKILETIKTGDVVEVKYLYATYDHRIYQPSFTRIRADKHPYECKFDQLEYTYKNIVEV